MGRESSTRGPTWVLWRALLVLVSVESFARHCAVMAEEPKRITYCGRAVSISDELSPKVLINSLSDPIGCKANAEKYRATAGETYTKCSVHEIVLRDGESTPLFGVEIGNVTGQVSAFLQPNHVRGICMKSDLMDSTTKENAEGPPGTVCFHRLEPAAKFLARTCSSRGCRNHFFLAAIGACGEPEVLEESDLSFAVAGIPMGWEGSILQSSDSPAAPLNRGTAALSSISSTPLYKIVLGRTEVLVLAGLPLDGKMEKVCLSRLFVYAPGEGESDIEVDRPCFRPGKPALKFVATTCSENDCIDHFFLASSGECNVPGG